MKKWLKTLGLAWLTALTLAWPVKEWIAASNQQTNKNVREVLGENKDSKIDKSNTYIMTAADFKEQEATDSVDVTQSLKQITQYTDQLVKFYGKEGLNTKVYQIMKEYPKFWYLTEKEQKDIMTKYFADFLKKNTDRDIMIGGLFAIMLTLRAISLHHSHWKSTHRYW